MPVSEIKNSCINTAQFNKKLLFYLFELGDKLKKLDQKRSARLKLQSLLNDKRACMYFNQPSTRTFFSFSNACHLLGIKISDIRDSENSSEKKGESFEDTIHTLSLYSDLIIMRHRNEDSSQRASALLINQKVKLINAGSGKDQHPTQALLDIYTIYNCLASGGKNKINGKTILIAGDLKRGRAARSLIYILKDFKIKFILASPDILKSEPDVISFIKENKNFSYIETPGIKEHLSEADVIYMTRIQDEYDNENESLQINYEPFKLKIEDLKSIKEDAIIMHPLPRRDEIDVKIDNDPRAKYWEQEKNGLYIRAALISYMFGVDKKIMKL